MVRMERRSSKICRLTCPGFCIQYRTAWIAPLIGMGTACFGLQIITTTCYTYAIDCYRPEGSEVSQVFNFFRQEIGMTFAFYTIHFADAIGVGHLHSPLGNAACSPASCRSYANFDIVSMGLLLLRHHGKCSGLCAHRPAHVQRKADPRVLRQAKECQSI